MALHHHGTITLEDGGLLAEHVHVALEEMERDGRRDWFGTLSTPEFLPLSAGQKYHLTLDDGRRGTFLVRRNTSAGEAGRAIAIHGIGALGAG
jgi:hypothetical protein